MIPDWFRVDADIVGSPKVGRLADALDVDMATAIGHVVAVYAGVRLHRPLDGSLVGVSDRTLEQWALWRGTRGQFAGAFRAEFVDGDPPRVCGWAERQAPLIKRVLAERDRAKRNREKSATPPGDGGPGGVDTADAEAYAESTRTNTRTGTRTSSRTVRRQQEQEQEQRSTLAVSLERTTVTTPASPLDEPPAVRPAPSPTTAVVLAGTVVGDLAQAAIVFTAAVNRGVADNLGGADRVPFPIRHDLQLEAAETILGAGVDPEWAAHWLYHRAFKANRRNLPRSLGYLAGGCVEAWRLHQTRVADQQHAAQFAPGADPTPRDDRRSAPFPPRESAAEITRRNSRVALDGLLGGAFAPAVTRRPA